MTFAVDLVGRFVCMFIPSIYRSWRMQCAKTVKSIVNCPTTPLCKIFSTEVAGEFTVYRSVLVKKRETVTVNK